VNCPHPLRASILRQPSINNQGLSNAAEVAKRILDCCSQAVVNPRWSCPGSRRVQDCRQQSGPVVAQAPNELSRFQAAQPERIPRYFQP
jgi:hypothetical protein